MSYRCCRCYYCCCNNWDYGVTICVFLPDLYQQVLATQRRHWSTVPMYLLHMFGLFRLCLLWMNTTKQCRYIHSWFEETRNHKQSLVFINDLVLLLPVFTCSNYVSCSAFDTRNLVWPLNLCAHEIAKIVYERATKMTLAGANYQGVSGCLIP